MEDWDVAGREPLFGHQLDWLNEILEALGTQELAAYAMPVAPEERGGVRFLVATELGLLDATRTVDAEDRPVMTTELLPWSATRDVRLQVETVLGPGLRRVSRWRLSLGQPELEVATDDAAALIDLWRECIVRSAQPPTIEPSTPPE
jgi:hypothetical protein